ncbi:hypothetical protein GF324_02835 [bacterium]|nr:hypothetical protein [bacterium]
MHRTGIPVLLSVLLILAWGTVAVGQTTQVKPASPESAALGMDPGLQKKVTIDADDASLSTVLSILAAESGYNIVTGPGVNKQDKISVHLRETPIEEAMNLVVRAAGLSYEVVGKSFLVASSSRLKEQVGLTSYVIELQNADAEEVIGMLEYFNADIKVDASGNRLLVITSPKVISEMQRVISIVDQAVPQVMLEARLIEVAVEDEERLGINWNRLTPFETILYHGTESPSPFRPGELPQQVPYLQINDANDFGYFGYQEPVFHLAIEFLLKNNMAEILANSQVATMNNKVAEIEVIDRIPFILSAGGVGGQVRTQTEEVGIKLKIQPLINSDGYITVDIEPEVSNVFQLIGPDQNIPWVVSRRAQTTIRVRNGESIIIAGLLGINRKNTIYKVPFLGDVPVIGGLFRNKTMSAKKTDLIIEITPHIISPAFTGIEKSGLIRDAEERAFDEGLEKMEEDDQTKPKRVGKRRGANRQNVEDEDLESLKDTMQEAD